MILEDQGLKNTDIFEQLYRLQEEYNSHTNITRINSKEDYYLKHIVDSLVLEKFIPNNSSLIDVGTGAGYPGLPIAIERPDVQVTLNDSAQKKTKYLEQVVEKLELKNVEIVKGRAEEIGRDPKYREQYAAATARAVAAINVLLEYLAPLVKVGGQILIMKAKDVDSEIEQAKNAEKILSLKLQEKKGYVLEGMERVLVIYQKIKSTPEKYPRKPGDPEKKPL